MHCNYYIKKYPVLRINTLSKNNEKFEMDNILFALENLDIPWIYSVGNYMRSIGFMESYYFECDTLYINVVISDIKTYDGLNSGELCLEEFISHVEVEKDDGSNLLKIVRLGGFLVCTHLYTENGINRWE